MVDLDKDINDNSINFQSPVHPLLKDYNPHRDGMGIRPQFRNVKKKDLAAAANNKRGAATMAVGGPVGIPGMDGGHPNGPGGVGGMILAGGAHTPRRRRRRNPTEKAAAAAAMAAAAMQERVRADKKKLEDTRLAAAAAAAAAAVDVASPSGGATSPVKGDDK